MPESITITDNRNGQSIEVPISFGGVSAVEWSKLLPGTWFYDPALTTTAACQSSISYLDGEAGVLRYRGYPIEELAERSSFLEVAYLLLFGELPDENQLQGWLEEISRHYFVHEDMRKHFFDGFHHDAHPMGVLIASVAGLSTYYPDAKDVSDPENRRHQAVRLIGKMPTLAAAAHRCSRGLPYIFPVRSRDYVSNFMAMMWQAPGSPYEPDPVFVRALDLLFILQAEHEQNCSTTVMRSVGSAMADPYSALAAACAALYGPRHGGANEAVVRMLGEIGSLDAVPAFVAGVKSGQGRLQGFGHRVYKNYDPRAKIIKKMAYEVLDVAGGNPLLDVALRLEEVALSDEYFLSRRLYPNVDFYSGLIYQAMGFPVEMFTVLFAIARTAGWLAHWSELIDQGSKIARPRQLYTGEPERHYLAMDQRAG